MWERIRKEKRENEVETCGGEIKEEVKEESPTWKVRKNCTYKCKVRVKTLQRKMRGWEWIQDEGQDIGKWNLPVSVHRHCF